MGKSRADNNLRFISRYNTPLGPVLLASDGTALTGLWFEGQKYFAPGLEKAEEKNCPVFHLAKKWLDIYFSGREPEFSIPVHITGSDFHIAVSAIMLSIPYGKTMSYGQIAEEITIKRGGRRTSARAVGRAVGHNAISIIVPCHRVIGSNGSLTGYAGGLERKTELLKLEGIDVGESGNPERMQ